MLDTTIEQKVVTVHIHCGGDEGREAVLELCQILTRPDHIALLRAKAAAALERRSNAHPLLPHDEAGPRLVAAECLP
jgi:hypothetical protein